MLKQSRQKIARKSKHRWNGTVFSLLRAVTMANHDYSGSILTTECVSISSPVNGVKAFPRVSPTVLIWCVKTMWRKLISGSPVGVPAIINTNTIEFNKLQYNSLQVEFQIFKVSCTNRLIQAPASCYWLAVICRKWGAVRTSEGHSADQIYVRRIECDAVTTLPLVLQNWFR